MRRRHRGLVALLPLALALAACRLAEVAAPPGSDVLVVEAVLRAGARQQYVILHRSLDGRLVRGESGARVEVSNAGGLRIEYLESDLRDCLVAQPEEWDIEDLEVLATCYVSPLEAGRFVEPGESYDLRVEGQSGEVLRGRTRVPQLFAFRSPTVAVNSTSLMTNCRLPTSSFTLAWSRSEGAWAYVSSLRLANWGDDLRRDGVSVPDPLELTGVSVSASDTTTRFPSDLGLFQRFDYDQRVLLALQDGLPDGADATLVVLAADRNYTNAIRGGRFNPSGNLRVSSVVGDGVGIFGSIVPLMIRSQPPGGPGAGSGNPCPMPAPTSLD